mmetsp:Transcript_36277/g.91351  ORF Transcript_36277/g.91351 Transcript_36277/m.91351 type:complete len:214 (+) Transcript_36277:130-771(+)
MMTWVRPCSRTRTCWHQVVMFSSKWLCRLSMTPCSEVNDLACSNSAAVFWCAFWDHARSVSRTSSTQERSVSVACSSCAALALSASPSRSSSRRASKRTSRLSRASASLARSAMRRLMRSSPAISSASWLATSATRWSRKSRASSNMPHPTLSSNLLLVSVLRSARARTRPSSTSLICVWIFFDSVLTASFCVSSFSHTTRNSASLSFSAACT